MKMFIAKYNHKTDRVERISPEFDTLAEAYEWNEQHGPRNADNELTGFTLNDFHQDYPVEASQAD